MQIYQNAINKFKVFKCLIKEKLAHMSADISIFQQYNPYEYCFKESECGQIHLKKELSSYGLTIIQTKPDGNSFFKL